MTATLHTAEAPAWTTALNAPDPVTAEQAGARRLVIERETHKLEKRLCRQVGEAIVQMDQVTQQNATMVEEMSGAASALRDQAQELMRTMEAFKLA